jgi:hypothetical protein
MRRANSWFTTATAGVLAGVGKAYIASLEQRCLRGGEISRRYLERSKSKMLCLRV